MKSSITLIPLLSFFLLIIGFTANARKVDPGEYWRNVMKDEAMPEAIKMHGHTTLISSSSSSSSSAIPGDDQKTKGSWVYKASEYGKIKEIRVFLRDFESTVVPEAITIYLDDQKLAQLRLPDYPPAAYLQKTRLPDYPPALQRTRLPDDPKLAYEKSYDDKDLEPIPNISIYHDDGTNKLEQARSSSLRKDLDPIPNISVYHGETKLEKAKSDLVKDMEPIPNVSIYHGDGKLKEKKSLAKDLEPIPNVSIYHDDKSLKDEKSSVNENQSAPRVSIL